MLYILMDAGPDTYAVASESVVEVVPCASLKSAPGAPPAVAGILAYRGRPVPVVDCGTLLAGRPCPIRFSTRIVLHRVEVGGSERVLGLMGENVTRVQSFDEVDFVEPGARSADLPCAGRVAALGGRWVQRLAPERVLAPDILRALTEVDV